MTARRDGGPSPPPRWFSRAIWALHRARYSLSGGRLGLRTAEPEQLGTLRLRTLGRRSGQERVAMLFYLTADRGLAVVASNAGYHADPAWWLNLQAAPEAFVDLPDGIHAVIGRAANQRERQRLWARFVALRDEYATYAAATSRALTVVILEPADLSEPVRSRR